MLFSDSLSSKYEASTSIVPYISYRLLVVFRAYRQNKNISLASRQRPLQMVLVTLSRSQLHLPAMDHIPPHLPSRSVVVAFDILGIYELEMEFFL